MPIHTKVSGKGIDTKEQAEAEFWRYQGEHKGKRIGPPQDHLQIIEIKEDRTKVGVTFEITYGFKPPKAETVVKAAGLPNAKECDGCQIWDADKQDCPEGNRPGTCGHGAAAHRIPEGSAAMVRAIVSGNVTTEKKVDKPVISNLPEIEKATPEIRNEIEVSKIKILNGWNPRKDFNEEKLQGLADSIKAIGLKQAVLVRPRGSGYELVIGERRLRAHRMIKAERIRADVREMTDDEVLDAMIAENVCREDLNPIEEANSIRKIYEKGKKTGLTEIELGRKYGKSQEWISQRLKLAEAPPELQEAIIRRRIFPGAAIEVLQQSKNEGYQLTLEEVLERAEDEELSLKDVRAIIGRYEMPEGPACSEGLINEDLPRDIVSFLKEGMMTLGAVGEIKKLDPFLAIYIEILRSCKERAALTKQEITEETAKKLICGIIIGDDHADRSLNLEEPPTELRERWRFFGKSECDQCPSVGHIHYPDENAGDREFCINKECYSLKLAKAQAALEEKEAKPKADSYEKSYERKEPEATELPTELPTEEKAEGKTQKCHVLSCTEQTEPDSHWCAKHQTPENRKGKNCGPDYNWSCRVSSGFCSGWSASEDELDDIKRMVGHLFTETGASPKAHEDALHRVLRCIREGGDTWGLLQKLFSKEAT